jgi:hypothetical protein
LRLASLRVENSLPEEVSRKLISSLLRWINPSPSLATTPEEEEEEEEEGKTGEEGRISPSSPAPSSSDALALVLRRYLFEL